MRILFPVTVICSLSILISCESSEKKQRVAGAKLDLKRGDVVSCGPTDGEIFGSVSFAADVPKDMQADFNKGIALLHSFEYDESEKMFARVVDNAPDCAMGYWGVAMSNFHPLWAPPVESELKKGKEMVDIARAIENKSQRETDYIEAIGKFYDNAAQLPHRERVLLFEKEMEKIYTTYTDDLEAKVFYALALNAAADPRDKSYARQKKAFTILEKLFATNPTHPGVAHYIIHNYDYPSLAEMALPAARKYATIAPSSAHALHMPSHIFTRLGLWDECVQINLVASSAAQCYAEKNKLKGHWDEELHSLDYIVYSYLQRGEDNLAKAKLDYISSFDKVDPSNFKTAYAFAAIPSRYALERKDWKAAAEMKFHPVSYEWEKYPWQKALVHFTRVLGKSNTNNLPGAKTELDSLKSLHAILLKQPEKAREAKLVEVQVISSEAWIALKEGKKQEAQTLMNNAAALEDGADKHPVTPGEIIPARELLGEMYLELSQPGAALKAFEESLAGHANKLRSLYGAARAAVAMKDPVKARHYYEKMIAVSSKESQRPELQEARQFIINASTVAKK